jgi:hypothetical protein
LEPLSAQEMAMSVKLTVVRWALVLVLQLA